MRRISFIKHALRKEPGQEYINRLIYTSPRAHKPPFACAIARARHVAPTAAQHKVANLARRRPPPQPSFGEVAALVVAVLVVTQAAHITARLPPS